MKTLLATPPHRGLLIFPILLLSALAFFSCKKTDFMMAQQNGATKSEVPEGFFKEYKTPGVQEESLQKNVVQQNNVGDTTDYNNGETEILLGSQLSNPYTVANMKQAYYNLYGSIPTISANNKYVRFKPSNADQLDVLLNTEDLELQDHPMDYTLAQDGDFYQDPTLGTEDIGWLYTVVPSNYVPPTGITYQVLSDLYLTDNIDWEGMAESMMAGATYRPTVINGRKAVVRTDLDNVIAYYPPDDPTCNIQDPYNPCSGGGGGGTTPDPNKPKGRITVYENRSVCGTTVTNPDANVPLRQARVVCKRWFKIWRGYTADDGTYTCSRRFKNKVKVIVKTKNDFAVVGKIRGIRVWQLLFPVKKRIGVFNQTEMANANYNFAWPANASASNKDLPYWAAATTHNSVVEFRQFSTQFGLPSPPNQLRMFVTNWGTVKGGGGTPMFNKCNNPTLPIVWTTAFLANANFILAGLTNLTNVLKNRVDMAIGYQPAGSDYNCNMRSRNIKQTVYHELGHAQHFTQAGCSFWTTYRNAIITESSKFNQPQFHPYGNGSDATTSGVIGVGEMWGGHCEYIYSNQYWGTMLPNAPIQGWAFSNVAGLNAYLNAIEHFNPNHPNDPFRWIPQGLPYDLMDNRNDAPNPIIDQVQGFTNTQIFNALQPNTLSIPLFRNNILQQAPAQQAQILNLFTQYNF